MNKKKNNRKIISVLIVLACFVLFAGVLLTGIRNYKTEKKENPVQGVSSESSLKGYLGKGYAYAGAQDNISAGEESFGEQAQLLEDAKDEEDEPQEQKQLPRRKQHRHRSRKVGMRINRMQTRSRNR